jgi:hypothetical protein
MEEHTGRDPKFVIKALKMYRHVYLPLNVHFSMKIKRFFQY